MYIGVWHNLPSGGGKRALYEHVKGLLANGHQVEAWCPPTADRSFLPLASILKENVEPLNIGSSNLPRPLRPPNIIDEARRTIAALDEHCSRCARAMERAGVELLFAGSCHISFCPPIGRMFKGPSVIYLGEPNRGLYEAWAAHWLRIPNSPPRSAFSPRSWWIWMKDAARAQASRELIFQERRNAEAFDRILVNSRFSRESVLRAYGLESSVCYLGVDSELFANTARRKSSYVIGLGQFHEGKGVDRAIRAIATVPLAKRPRLVWVGNGNDDRYCGDCRALAASLGVDFHPRMNIADRELTELLSGAATMLYTSRLEPFGLAPLEANACGSWVVAIAEGGVRESISPGRNGTLVDDDNPCAVAAAVLPLVSDLGLAASLGSQARAHVIENWGWRAAHTRLNTVLGDVAGA